MKEEWKPIEGFDDYEVSNLGNVRSFKKGDEKIMSIQEHRLGYQYLKLYNNNNEQRPEFVHRLVAIAFIPNPENKPQVNHKNGIKTDNRVENLCWVTHIENQQHAWETGLKNSNHMIGSNNNHAVLNEDNVYLIKWLLEHDTGLFQTELAFIFDVCNAQISSIKTGREWKHVQLSEDLKKKDTGEIWKDIPGFEGFQASNEGRIRKTSGKLLKLSKSGNRGLVATVCKKTKLVHYLVALTFIPNPDNKPQVLHLDYDKTNNHIENLNWSTHKENMAHYKKKDLSGGQGIDYEPTEVYTFKKELAESITKKGNEAIREIEARLQNTEDEKVVLKGEKIFRPESDEPIEIRFLEDVEPAPLPPPSGTIFYMENSYNGEKKELPTPKPLYHWQKTMINDLRQRTGHSLSKCKRILEENYWDFYTALEELKNQKVCKCMPHHGYKKED